MFGFFGLGGLIYVGIFFFNAICILSEDRFLARIGFTQGSQQASFGSTPEQSMSLKLMNLITSIRLVARVPLIFINALVIVYELILG